MIDVVKKTAPPRLTVPSLARDCFVEEMADVAMYFFDVLLCTGVSAEEFSHAYYTKQQHNLKRNYRRDNAQRYGE